jgi:hypothetical protein
MFGVTFDHITRQEALRLCLLRDCGAIARAAGYKIGVAMTASLWNLAEDDFESVVMLAIKASWQTEDLRVLFWWRGTRLKVEMTCEAVGDPPCLTIMFPDEY